MTSWKYLASLPLCLSFCIYKQLSQHIVETQSSRNAITFSEQDPTAKTNIRFEWGAKRITFSDVYIQNRISITNRYTNIQLFSTFVMSSPTWGPISTQQEHLKLPVIGPMCARKIAKFYFHILIYFSPLAGARMNIRYICYP